MCDFIALQAMQGRFFALTISIFKAFIYLLIHSRHMEPSSPSQMPELRLPSPPQGGPNQNPQQSGQVQYSIPAPMEYLRQLQTEIFGSSKYLKATLDGLLFSSEFQDRLFVSKDNPEGKKQKVLSHIPDNLMYCPHIDKDGIHCINEVDVLPPVINLDNPPTTICPDHTMRMVWKNWKPPCTEIGFKAVVDQVMASASSENIGMGYLDQEFQKVLYAVAYSEGVMESIYENKDTWVSNKEVFMNEGFNFTLQNAICTNIEVAVSKAQGKQSDKLITSWNVNQTQPDQQNSQPQQQSQGGGIFASFAKWAGGK